MDKIALTGGCTLKTYTSSYLDEDVVVDDEDWYMLTCKGYYCENCERIRAYLHITASNGDDAIIIFPTMDDIYLLESAAAWQRRDLDPHIREYHPDLGLSITIYDVCKILGTDYNEH